jgi:hypothetical protein
MRDENPKSLRHRGTRPAGPCWSVTPHDRACQKARGPVHFRAQDGRPERVSNFGQERCSLLLPAGARTPEPSPMPASGCDTRRDVDIRMDVPTHCRCERPRHVRRHSAGDDRGSPSRDYGSLCSCQDGLGSVCGPHRAEWSGSNRGQSQSTHVNCASVNIGGTSQPGNITWNWTYTPDSDTNGDGRINNDDNCPCSWTLQSVHIDLHTAAGPLEC